MSSLILLEYSNLCFPFELTSPGISEEEDVFKYNFKVSGCMGSGYMNTVPHCSYLFLVFIKEVVALLPQAKQPIAELCSMRGQSSI
jgi:hypothetical protein